MAYSTFIALPLSLPPTPSSPTPATHYIYLRSDSPKNPTPDTPRSVFVSNVPVDSSEASFRALFKQVNGALVDRVEFDDDAHRTHGQRLLVKGQSWGDEGVQEKRQTGRKRKRKMEEEESSLADEYALPGTWGLRTRKSGSSAVVVFVDKPTADSVLKECRRLVKKHLKLEWRPAEVLGIKSMVPKPSFLC
jgi:ribosomal RNA-processing protein 7